MNRVLSLLVVTAIVNVTLSRRGYRPAERNSVSGSDPWTNSRQRSVGTGYGMGRYSRAAGAGGDTMVEGCGMATMDKCYKTLPLNDTTPQNLIEQINDLETPEMCQWFCRDIYGSKCTWFLYDKKSTECKLFEGSPMALYDDCRQHGYSVEPNFDMCNGVQADGSGKECENFRESYCRYDMDLLDNLEGIHNSSICQEACRYRKKCNFFQYFEDDKICKLQNTHSDLRECDIIHGTPTPTLESCNYQKKIKWASGLSHWGYGKYNGPKQWGKFAPVCGTGRSQSPVDLVLPSGAVDHGAITFSSAHLSETMQGTLKNNGHSVVFGASMPNNFTIQDGPYNGEVYQFLQLHFHWGSKDTQGSEHTINGTEYPMELHMVHINSKYVDAEGNLDGGYATNADGLAVLGFMFEVNSTDFDGLENITSGIQSIVANRPSRKRGVAGHTENIELQLAPFLQSVMSGGYFTLSGSLTTPGCNEVVTWVVFKDAIQMSSSQLAHFRSLKDGEGKKLVDNYRPPLPLNGRAIGFGSN